jgi:hypothetical protein
MASSPSEVDDGRSVARSPAWPNLRRTCGARVRDQRLDARQRRERGERHPLLQRPYRQGERIRAVLLLFFALLREYLRSSRAARPFGTIALPGAVVFAVSGCIQAGLAFSLADVPTKLTPGAAQALNVLSSDLGTGLIIGLVATGVWVLLVSALLYLRLERH